MTAPLDPVLRPTVLFNRECREKKADAIVGSSAGIIVDNEIRVASLLLSFPEEHFETAEAVFKRVSKEWKVPIVTMNDRDATALAGARSIGVYLGYTIPHYLDFYDVDHMLVLGRVTTGTDDDIVLSRARKVLSRSFPEYAYRIQMHDPDEKARRVGQTVAAASFPKTDS